MKGEIYLQNLFQVFNAPPDVHTKQLIVLEVVDGPSVQDFLSKTFSPFYFILTIFFYYLF